MIVENKIKEQHKQALIKIVDKKNQLKQLLANIQFQLYNLKMNKNKTLEQLVQAQKQLVKFIKKLTQIYGEGYIDSSNWTYHKEKQSTL